MRSVQDDVKWYRRFGRYPDERITRDGLTREPYIIGDKSWNDGRRPGREEYVERRMDDELGPWPQPINRKSRV